jgi:hypothetical protein
VLESRIPFAGVTLKVDKENLVESIGEGSDIAVSADSIERLNRDTRYLGSPRFGRFSACR